MKSRAPGFSQDEASQLINLLERTVEHNAIRICLYNIDETALTTL
jgi:hypothetical protein